MISLALSDASEGWTQIYRDETICCQVRYILGAEREYNETHFMEKRRYTKRNGL